MNQNLAHLTSFLLFFLTRNDEKIIENNLVDGAVLYGIISIQKETFVATETLQL